MATISTKTVKSLVISEDEKCWLAFGNLALAEIANCVNQMGDEIMNENTGEILETSDIKHAFAIIDTLIDKEAHWVEVEKSETDDYEEPYYDECGFNPYMGCYDYDC